MCRLWSEKFGDVLDKVEQRKTVFFLLAAVTQLRKVSSCAAQLISMKIYAISLLIKVFLIFLENMKCHTCLLLSILSYFYIFHLHSIPFFLFLFLLFVACNWSRLLRFSLFSTLLITFLFIYDIEEIFLPQKL